jgi:hypothetical protein
VRSFILSVIMPHLYTLSSVILLLHCHRKDFFLFKMCQKNYDKVCVPPDSLTQWSRVLEMLVSSQLVKKFPIFCGTQRFITVFRIAHHLSLSRATFVQSMPSSHVQKIHLYIILPSMCGSPKLSLCLRFPHQNPEYTSVPLCTCYLPWPLHYSRFGHLNNIG